MTEALQKEPTARTRAMALLGDIVMIASALRESDEAYTRTVAEAEEFAQLLREPSRSTIKSAAQGVAAGIRRDRRAWEILRLEHTATELQRTFPAVVAELRAIAEAEKENGEGSFVP